MTPLAELILQIRSIMDLDPDNLTDPYDKYLDLGKIERVDRETLETHRQLPEHDPFLELSSLLQQYIRLHRLEHLYVGLNELFKIYLLLITPRNQEYLTRQVWQVIETLVHYSLKTEYPYTARFWNYLSNCAEPVLVFIIDQSYLKAAKNTLKCLMELSHMAVRAGLHTSKLQHTLRVVELKCSEYSHSELLAIAEEYRQNMEV
ncbi:hypothetical protein MFMK1_003287 [Metallumcola ferriviriculae]|uniref:Uncharacterized protein n=1 Tax=Metallumcola ferriviriculae TaxID=3039180 RepID=A0AAU0USA4_9FIRM|nr:hypothetical protein MFMK1_003287 [Desulfitibacteraceae bacterium MK1]